MVTDSNQTSFGDLVMYKDIESPWCMPEINRVIYVYYSSVKKWI